VIYLIDPPLTGASVVALELFRALVGKLEPYGALSLVKTEESLSTVNPVNADAVVFANPEPPGGMTDAATFLIEAAQASGALVMPVAATVTSRTPPGPVDAIQSFDVVERLRARSLPDTATGLAAADLSRRVLARVQPTMNKTELRVFLSYRREDGDGPARRLDAALSARHDHVFRDLVDIQDGAVAQDVIAEALDRADVLVFLDSPKAGSSPWIAEELTAALGRQVPIVWVRLGPDEGRVVLRVKPAARPHLAYDDGEPLHEDMAEAVLDAAFGLAREHVRTAQNTFSQIRRQAKTRGMSVETLDQRQLIYALTESSADRDGYPRRAHSDVVQIFGHRPTRDDRQRLEAWLTENDYGPHSRTCRAYDAAVLLDPLPRRAQVDEGSSMVLDNAETFLARMRPLPAAAPARTLLLFGAFPEGADSQEPVKQAVHALSAGWLARGGSVVFGGHPTFTPLIVDVARSTVGDLATERVTIYQSEYWVSPTLAEAYGRLAAIVLVPASDDKEESLTRMRRRMVGDSAADIAVAIGGRTSEGGQHTPGVDEEIALAREASIPVYLLGAPGGRATELAAEAGMGPTGRLTGEQVAELFNTEDYTDAVKILWDHG
jgi:hypothetical protein